MAEQVELDDSETLIAELVSNITAFIEEENLVGETFSAAQILESLGFDISGWN